MTHIESVTLEAPDPGAVEAFAAAVAPGLPVRARTGDAPTTGFRGYTLSLVVPQPSVVDALVDAALRAGGTAVQPPRKSLWGYGGSVSGPDGSIWTFASSAKKDKGPVDPRIDEFIVQIGVEDVAASKRFLVERGLQVAKSFGRRYVQFAAPSSPISLALLNRRTLAKNAGVAPEGEGSHRIAITSAAGDFTDPDGFTWEAAG